CRVLDERLGRVLLREDLLHLLAAVVADQDVAQHARVLRVEPDARVVTGMGAGTIRALRIHSLCLHARTPARNTNELAKRLRNYTRSGVSIATVFLGLDAEPVEQPVVAAPGAAHLDGEV